jgi:hypothetical protein
LVSAVVVQPGPSSAEAAEGPLDLGIAAAAAADGTHTAEEGRAVGEEEEVEIGTVAADQHNIVKEQAVPGSAEEEAHQAGRNAEELARVMD